VREHRDELGGLLEDVVAIIDMVHEILDGNRDRLTAILEDVETAADEGVELLRSARTSYVDGERPRRIMSRIDRLLGTVDREAGPLLADLRATTTSARETLETIGPDERTEIRETIHAAARISGDVEGVIDEATEIVHHVRSGEGTVGALLMDEEVYDDLAELIRDLKHNPWKFFWRE
jgi:phospholipid/cholesterol/gamma-HCH transport system substrate-binding protein